MNFNDIIKESLETTVKNIYKNNKEESIYKINSSNLKDFPLDLKDLYNESKSRFVRFILTLNGKSIYVFSGHLLHNNVVGKLGIDYNNLEENIFGEGYLDSLYTKITNIESAIFDGNSGPRTKKIKNELLSKNWKWADKFFDKPVDEIIRGL